MELKRKRRKRGKGEGGERGRKRGQIHHFVIKQQYSLKSRNKRKEEGE